MTQNDDSQSIRFFTLLNDIFDKYNAEELVFMPEKSYKEDTAGMRQDVYESPDGKYCYTVQYFRGEPKQIMFVTPQVTGTFYA